VNPHGPRPLRDGHVARRLRPDASGRFDFTARDDEIHRIANEQARDAAVVVFGRRMYELIEDFWPAAVAAPEELSEVARLAREHNGHVEVGGPTLAAAVFDLIDEFRTWVNPVAVGGGKPYFPADGQQLRLRLRLLEQRAFASGALYLRYERVR
jgi:dihydrofolate reductase